jgi:hypothetical protein
MKFSINYFDTNIGPLKVNTIIFLLAFAIGMFYVYVTHPEPIIIIKHPNPENVSNLVYKDDNDACYKYKASEVDCPADNNLVNEHPITVEEK